MEWWKWGIIALIGIAVGVGIGFLTTSPSYSPRYIPPKTASSWIPIPPEPHFAPLHRATAPIFPPSSTSKQTISSTPTPSSPSKPRGKLVIVMDDMAFKWEAKALHSLHLRITPSFFPPTPRHPNTPQLAATFPVYMVHLPLESRGFKYAEQGTLPTSAPFSAILRRIGELKRLFPKARYFNNHTGSTFTANLPAMERLFRALKFYNLGFLDSRTTPATKSYYANLKYNIPLLSRNIFLDNRLSHSYMWRQLKKAVKLARERGIAILICHPYRATFRFLKGVERWLPTEVEVVYITSPAVTSLASRWRENTPHLALSR